MLAAPFPVYQRFSAICGCGYFYVPLWCSLLLIRAYCASELAFKLRVYPIEAFWRYSLYDIVARF